MSKRAVTEYPLDDSIAERWSPRAFDAKPVEREKLGSLFEAARWAPSCFNEQPWSFFVGLKGEGEDFDRLASCLVEGNAWARTVPVLILSVAKTRFARNDKPNRHAQHDVGLAVQSLVLQAQSLGLATHQMAGFDVDRARATLKIPADCEPMAMIALGYPGDASALEPALAERELAPRTRKNLGAIVFGSTWGESFNSL